MSKRNKKGRVKFYFFLIIVVLLIYNPISARIMTVGVAITTNVDIKIFYNLIKAESSFRSLAYSSQKAIGLGQMQVNTFNYVFPKQPGVLIWFPPSNLFASAKYLKYLNKKFKGNWTLTLAAYNWGETNVLKRIRKMNIVSEADYRYKFKDIPETYAFLINILGDKK